MRLPFEGFHRNWDPGPHEYEHPDYDPFPTRKTYLRYLRRRGIPKRHTWEVSQAMSDLQSEVTPEIGDDDKIVFHVTVRYKYETTGANLKAYYGTTSLSEAATIDANNLYNDPQHIAEDLNHNGEKYTIAINATRVVGDK